jgi:uncharacterized membrane protein YczE
MTAETILVAIGFFVFGLGIGFLLGTGVAAIIRNGPPPPRNKVL